MWLETGTGIVTMWPWHDAGTLGSCLARVKVCLARCHVSGVPCHRWTSCVSLTWSHPASGLGNSHLWFSLNLEISPFRSLKAVCYQGMQTCVMAYGSWEESHLTRFVYMCHSNMCYMSDCLMSVSVSTCQTGSCQPPATSTNLPLTIVLTKEENRNKTLDTEIMDRYTGLVCLDIHRSIFPEDIKVSM